MNKIVFGGEWFVSLRLYWVSIGERSKVNSDSEKAIYLDVFNDIYTSNEPGILSIDSNQKKLIMARSVYVKTTTEAIHVKFGVQLDLTLDGTFYQKINCDGILFLEGEGSK